MCTKSPAVESILSRLSKQFCLYSVQVSSSHIGFVPIDDGRIMGVDVNWYPLYINLFKSVRRNPSVVLQCVGVSPIGDG